MSFVPSPSDPVPVVPSHSGRGRGRGRGRASTSSVRGVGRGISRSGNIIATAAQVSLVDSDVIVSEQEYSTETAIDVDMEVEIAGHEAEEGDDNKLVDEILDVDDPHAHNGDVEEMIEAAIDPADSSATVLAADVATTDTSEDIATGNADSGIAVCNAPVVIERTHPLFGLWTGTFDVRGVNGKAKHPMK